MYATLSALIQKALSTDAEAQERLQAMDACTVRLELEPLPAMGWSIRDGRLTVEEPSAHPDLSVRGHAAAFARYALGGRTDGIHLEGKAEAAQQLRALLAQLDIDWEALLAERVGGTPARLLARTGAEFAQTARRIAKAAEANAQDYLHEESGLLPRAEELERFVRDVDRLRDDADRLELRLDRLRLARRVPLIEISTPI